MTNSFGKLFTITSFGESHGRCMGVIVDGCPSGLPVSEADIQKEVDRRKSASVAATSRVEADRAEVLSGISDGFTSGAPVCMLIWNQDIDSSDYERIRHLLRPGHADYTKFVKYGGFAEWRGGGRFSGRITLSFVMAGAIARKLLGLLGVEIVAHTVEIGGVQAKPMEFDEIKKNAEQDELRCADPAASKKMTELIGKVKEEGDSLGGIVEGIAKNVPVGLGEPAFDRLDGELAKAMMLIPAVKGVEFGAGFAAARMKGSEHNDPFVMREGKLVTATNNAGGLLGGISTGMPIVVRVAVKPTSSIAKEQETVDIQKMENATISVEGRHDACIVPRAVIVVESMMAATLCDFALRAGLIPRVIR